MILVSGGTGVMGGRLVRDLAGNGQRVRALTLPNDPFVSRLEGVDCEIVYADISDTHSLRGVFDDIETVYHLAAIIIAPRPGTVSQDQYQWDEKYGRRCYQFRSEAFHPCLFGISCLSHDYPVFRV